MFADILTVGKMQKAEEEEESESESLSRVTVCALVDVFL